MTEQEIVTRNLVIAGAAWGEHYVDMLLNYCLPSMLPSIEAVTQKRKVLLSLHTDSIDRINKSRVMMELIRLGIEARYYPVEDDINTGEKYSLLGKYQELGLNVARENHADYHSLMPDHVYSCEFFTGMMAAVERGHLAITRLCLSTSLEAMAADIQAYRIGAGISIDSANLAAMAFKNIHPRSAVWEVKGASYPNIHVTFFAIGNTLTMFSPHQSIVYLDRDEILPVHTTLPLDNELSKIMHQNLPIYCPQPHDRMGWVEVARVDNETCTDRARIKDFCEKYWIAAGIKHPKYLHMQTQDHMAMPVTGGVSKPRAELCKLILALRESLHE